MGLFLYCYTRNSASSLVTFYRIIFALNSSTGRLQSHFARPAEEVYQFFYAVDFRPQ